MVPEVQRGPWLLRSPRPDLWTHRSVHGHLPTLTLHDLLTVTGSAQVRGRGGAGFPFARKLHSVASGRGSRHVVVNFSEGEPASDKDRALALTQPHLVLDGAAMSAHTLGARQVHLVLPEEHREVRLALEQALSERGLEPGNPRWRLHFAAPRFVSGESSAVVELVQGRPGLPVTSWEPTAVSGVRGRPTLLSNAETFAHVAALALGGSAYAALGTPEEPGTTLLTISSESGVRVLEVPFGTGWEQVLAPADLEVPVLVGGYHGTWAPAGALRGRTVSATGMAEQGLALGAGVVLVLPRGTCPLERTAGVMHYLAQQSAGRCGPCFNGLPALAAAFEERLAGVPDTGVGRLMELVAGRGACAHPDGAVRLLDSALNAFPDELLAHTHGHCLAAPASEVPAR